MYEPGTVLTLREPQSTDDTAYPYDRVEVVGQSPVQHATASGSIWAGADATGFIIRPLSEFAPTVDKPLGELQSLYEVESYPVDPITQEPITPQNNPRNQPSPEQLLARAAEGQPKAEPRKPAGVHVQADNLSPEQALKTAGPKPTTRKKS